MKLKIKRIRIHPESLVHIMTVGSIWEVVKGVPQGAIVKYCTIDPYAVEINIFIEHDSFEPVEIGLVCPSLETELHRLKEK